MPIRPENRALYPAPDEWEWIRACILNRASHRCEQCGRPNRVTIWVIDTSAGGGWIAGDGTRYDDCGRPIEKARLSCGEPEFMGRPVETVLTIAHLDHDPTNNDPANLRAWCQRCHNRHDAGHRKITRANTMRGRLNNLELFAE